MVKVRENSHIASDGSIHLEAWLQYAANQRTIHNISLVRHACVLAQLAGEHHAAPTGISCLQQGLTIAEILLELGLDAETLAAALVYSCAHYADLSHEDIKEHLGNTVAKLVQGTIQMDAVRNLQHLNNQTNGTQLENVRKMLLAMANDVRVVLIKLAERTATMRTLDALDKKTQKHIAQESMDIYAPLANRLGIGQIKWELEDRSLRYLDTPAYQEIANFLAERRIDRDNYIQNFVEHLEQSLKKAGLKDFTVTGRAKHIYSIYRKMKRKKLGFHDLYDINAVRVLVNTIEDCYTALGIAHGLWHPIQKEFDDYIATPKPNGYRSIHTAVVGPNNKNVEIQIRTLAMHQESEHGVAAHWRYKEGGQQKANYEAKIAWLRQVLSWQKELAHTGQKADLPAETSLDDRVYVFTPTGDIIDMPTGSTPLDFAYHIHSEVGHRCRGAKINGSIVPLTYVLNTGEQVEVLTAKQPNPSRDWINPHLGYLRTSRAKAKVHHWFKLQDFDKNAHDGQSMLERECQRLALPEIDQEKIAHKLHYRSHKEMFAALGCGDLRMAQVLGAIQAQIDQHKKAEINTVEETTIPLRAPSKTVASGINIAGVGDLLTFTAKCCKPVPGDAIVGYITHGRGVAIHLADCTNILNLDSEKHDRLMEVAWGEHARKTYPVDIFVEAYDRPGLVRDVTTLIANEKLSVVALTTTTNRIDNTAHLTITFEIQGLNSLSKIFDRIKNIPNVINVHRKTTGH